MAHIVSSVAVGIFVLGDATDIKVLLRDDLELDTERSNLLHARAAAGIACTLRIRPRFRDATKRQRLVVDADNNSVQTYLNDGSRSPLRELCCQALLNTSMRAGRGMLMPSVLGPCEAPCG